MGKKKRKKSVQKEGPQRRVRTFSIPLRKYPLVGRTKVQVPREIEVPIFLIRNELQSRMLFNTLNELGFSDGYYETFLDSLILACLRLNDGSDDTFNFYNDLMERWSKDLNPDKEVLTRRAIKIYNALTKFRIDVFETMYVRA